MSNHYDADIQAMKDYEALNADTARQLSKAKIKIKCFEVALERIANLPSGYICHARNIAKEALNDE